MLSKRMQIILAFVATATMAAFIIGLAHSISTGFAGFWGGLPFWVISISVLLMAAYDFIEETVLS